jgi:hypothetical protein
MFGYILEKCHQVCYLLSTQLLRDMWRNGQ